MRMLDLEIAGEFLVMAATLMYIKSRELLPRDQQVQTEGEDDGEDPRWELIRQLVEYKKFKDAAVRLQQLEIAQENSFPRVPGKPEFPEESGPLKPTVSLFDLVTAVGNILKRFTERTEDEREIFQDRWTVSEKIEFIVKLLADKTSLKFSELFADAASRTEIVVTFLALLELIRLKQIVAVQQQEFGEIELAREAQVQTAMNS
jgi:segregation and condensation protein A